MHEKIPGKSFSLGAFIKRFLTNTSFLGTLLVVFGLCYLQLNSQIFGTRLEDPELYSFDLNLRLQTESFLQGKIALQPYPYFAGHDWSWGVGGMQQHWGLGVPLLRLPFEYISKTFFERAFPDRLVFGFLYALAFFSFWKSVRAIGIDRQSTLSHDLLIFLLVITFPALAAMFRIRAAVWEEVIAFASVWSILLAALLLNFCRNLSFKNWLLVVSVAGFLPFIRLTAICYSFAALALCCAWGVRSKFSRVKLLAGLAVFTSFQGLLLVTNYLRFGSFLEFGYSTALTGEIITDYAQHFVSPYASEALWPATQELFMSLFFVDRLAGYAQAYSSIHSWQSSLPRFREFYFQTYNAIHCVLFCAFILICMSAHWKCIRRKQFGSIDQDIASDLRISLLGVWAIVSFSLLFSLYLYFLGMTSRYAVDFYPAIVVSLAGLCWSLSSSAQRKLEKSLVTILFAFMLIAQIFANQAIFTPPDYVEYYYPKMPDLVQSQVQQAIDVAKWKQQVEFPTESLERYACGVPRFEFNITHNPEGWDIDSNCAVKSFTAFYLYMQDCLTLTVRSSEIEDIVWQKIRVKKNLQELKLVSSADEHGIRRLRYCLKTYDLQPSAIDYSQISIAWLPVEQVEESPPIELLAVEADR